MLIDFHTHIFPDEIAPRTIQALIQGIRREQGEDYVNSHTMNYSDGTISGLLRSMDENGVDMSVCLPIVTKESQTPSINRFAKTIRTDRLTSFGSLHPMQADWEAVLEELAENGFRGVKLHHQFQQCPIDSKESIRILRKAKELGLLVIFHAGHDIGLPGDVMASPERIRNVLTEMDGSHLIAAHLGGWQQWDDVEKYLVGSEIFLDTAFIQDFIPSEQCLRIIRNHGASRILFATDSPWESPSDTKKFLDSLPLTAEEYRMITSENARKLLFKQETS